MPMTERPGLARAGSHDADLQRRFAASRRHRPALSHCFEPACAAGRLAADSLVPARWRVSLRAGACACGVAGAALRGAGFMPSGAAGMAPGVRGRGRGRGRDASGFGHRACRGAALITSGRGPRARPSGRPGRGLSRRTRTRCCPGAWASIPSRRPAARAATPPSPVHPRSARPVRRARVDASGPIHPPASPSPIHKDFAQRLSRASRVCGRGSVPVRPCAGRVRRPLPFPDP